MGIQRSVYHIYGVRIHGDISWDVLENDLGQCTNDGETGCFRAGAYDRHSFYLALWWKRIEPGEEVFHSGTRPVATQAKRDRWNSDLLAVADRFGLVVAQGPGWFTIPSES